MNNNIISILIIVGLILGFVSTSTANNLNNTTHLLTSNNTSLANETINKTLNITNNNTNNKILTYNPISAMVLLDTVYVSNKGNDDNTGKDWNNSVATLEKALERVKSNGTIILNDGIYQVPEFQRANNVILKSKNGPTKTIITTQMYIDSYNSTNIEGIGFENCSSDYGAALINDGHLYCNNCIFKNCISEAGGAIANAHKKAILKLTNCVFENCSALRKSPTHIDVGRGGAIINIGNLTVSNCVFRNNIADLGGMIYNVGGLNISSSNFYYNTAENGGVIYNIAPNGSNVMFKSCDFIGNNATKGIIAYDEKYYYGYNVSLIIFDSCYFDPNSENNFVGDVLNINQVLSKTNDTSNNTNTTNSTNSSIISTLLTKKSHMLTPLLLSYNPMGETIIPASEKVEEPLTINYSNKNIITPLTILILLISSVIYMKHRS